MGAPADRGGVPGIVRQAKTVRRLAARLLLPRSLRRQHGGEMQAAFDQLVDEAGRERGAGGVGAALLREVADLVRAGGAVRWRRWSGRLHQTRREAGMRKTTTSGLLGDARLAARTLVRRPGYAALAVTTLGLGVGGGAALYTLVRDVVLDPLEYPRPDRLAHVFLTNPELGWERGPVSFPVFDEWRRRNDVFSTLSAYQAGLRWSVRVEGETRLVRGTRVTGELFRTLGVPPAEGRWIEPADEGAGRESVVVLSGELRRQLFQGETAVGRRVDLGEGTRTVVGVMPDHFLPLHRASRFWVPFAADPSGFERDQSFLAVLGRLRRGVEPEAARRSMEALARTMERADPAGLEGRAVRVEPRWDVVTTGVRGPLLLLLGAVGLLLALAAANLTGLALARAADRRRELAVRRALGAGRSHLVRHLTLEAVVVALAGGAAALPVAGLALRALLAAAPADLPRRAMVALDAGSLLFGLAVLGGVVMAFGVVPALLFAPREPGADLREGGRGSTGVSGLQRGLVVGQVAAAVVLLIGAGLLTSSLLRLSAEERGFDERGVLTFRLHPPADAYQAAEELDAMYDRVVEALRALPDVEAVGATWALPFGEMYGSSSYRPADRPDGEEYLLQLVPVRGDYFEAMGVQPVQGRLFRPGDGREGRPVTVVNRTFAERAWPGSEAVGRRLREASGEDSVPLEVIGVVPDMALMAVGETPQLQSFWPHASAPWARELYFTVRTGGAGADPLDLVPAVRAVVGRIDERMPVADVATMSGRLREQLAGPRFRALVVDALAGLAVILVLLGVYGVTTLFVARRTREIGLRMALGAERRAVLGEVLGDGAALALRGALIGLVVSIPAGRALEGLLFGVEPLEPSLYAGSVAAVLVVTLLAAWIPAHRAGRVDPLEALRAE